MNTPTASISPRRIIAPLAALLSLSPLAFAQTNGQWTLNNSGTWSTGGNWLIGNIADGAGATADFSQLNISTARTITIDGAVASRTIGTLLFGDSDSTHGYTLAASGGGTLTFNNNGTAAAITQGANSGANIISAPVLLADSLNTNNNSASLLTVSGTLSASTAGTKTITNQGSGNGGVTLSGVISDGSGSVAIVQNSTTSALTLSGINTFNGGVTIKKGTVNLGANSAALGSGSATIGDSAGGSNAASLIGNNSLTYAGGIVLASNTSGTLTIGSATTAAAIFSGGVTGNNNLTLAAGGTTSTLTLSTATVNNAGSITNVGTSSGTVTLSGGVGSNVTGIEQNSTTSALTISGGLAVNSGGTTLTNTAGTKALTVSGAVGGTGNLILNNNSSLAAGISLSTGGVNNTGTITNTGTGSGTTTISGIIGTNVSGVVQNSVNSQLTLSGTNTFSTGTTIKQGTVLANSDAALGTGTVLLGDTSGAANATLSIGSVTVANNITVQAGSTGTLTLMGNGGSAARPTGNILLNNDLTLEVTTNGSGRNTGAFLQTSGTISGTQDLNLNVSGGLSTSNNTGAPQLDSLSAGGLITTTGAINNVGTGEGRAIITGNISNASSLNQNSATSMLTLTGTNTYSGVTNVNAGVLRAATSADALSVNSAITVASGASLQINNTQTTTQILTLSGKGTSYSSGALSATAGATYAGAIVLATDTEISSTNGITTLTLSGGITGPGKTLTVSGVANTTVSSAIATGSGGVIKEGVGVLTLSGSNTYTGLTRINQGTLAVTSAGALGGGGEITFDGGSLRHSATNLLDYSGRIVNSTGPIAIDTNAQNIIYAGNIASSNTGGLTKLGTGRLTLSGTNAFTGPIVVNGGTLTVGAISALPSIGTGILFIDNGAALNTGGAYANVQAWLDSDNISTASSGAIALTAGSAENIDFTGYDTLSLGTFTNATYTGTLTAANSTYRLGGGLATLTLSGANALTGANGLFVNGLVTLTNANNLSGATTVNSGTLTLGSAGTLANSATTAGPGATLAVTTATSGSPIARAASLKLTGGTFIVTGNATANSIDTITGALTLGSGGNSTVTLTPNAGKNTLLTAGSLAREAGATALIRGTDLGVSAIASSVAGDSSISFITAPTLVGGAGSNTTDRGILIGMVGDTSSAGTGFGATGGLLTYDTTSGVRLLSGSEYKTSITDGQTQLDNVRLSSASGTATTTVNSDTILNSLTFELSGTVTTNVAIGGTGKLTLNSGVIYSNSTNTRSTSSSSFNTNTVSNSIDFNGREAVILVGGGNGYVNLSGVLSNTAGNGLTIHAPGRTVTLSGATANTYTGVTTVNGGTLTLGKTAGVNAITGNLVINSGASVSHSTANQIADTATVTVNGGSFDYLSETINSLDVTNSGSATASSTTTALVVTGVTTLSNGGTITLARSQNINGLYDSVATFGGGLNITNTSSGAYTAITLGHGSGLGQSGAKLILGGDVTFTGNTTNTNTVFIDAIKGSGRKGVIELTAASGNRTLIIGNGAAATDLKITAALLDGAGGASGLIKSGLGTLALSGANTYSGNTSVNAGALTFSEGGSLTFYISANGVNNSVTGSGTATFSGSFNFDLTNAVASDGNSWTLVSTGTLSESFTGSFAISGFTENSNVWTNGSGYSFSEATGILSYSAVPEPSAFAFLGGSAALAFVALRRRRGNHVSRSA